MKLSEYSVPITDGMIVKNGTKIRFTVKAGNTVLEDDLTPAEYIGGAITRAGIMYNAASMSGGVSWWNPATGRPISRPKIQMRVRPVDINKQ